MRIAQALTRAQQQNPAMYEPGLAQPPEMNALRALSQIGQGYGMGRMGGSIAHALSQTAVPALQGLGEAGAIFPEGSALPKSRDLAKELMDMLPDSQRAYRTNEALANWHAKNYDWPRVLQDKWALLKNTGGS